MGQAGTSQEAEVEDGSSVMKSVGEFSILLLIAALIHGLVLRFIFPGAYEPTAFDHDDFYMPLAVMHSGGGILSMLAWPRPVGMVYLYATGYLGIAGSIWATLGVILSNIAMVGMLIRRISHIRFDVFFSLCFALFCLLIFAHPYFYTMAAHDSFAQLSFLFLSAGLFIFVPRRHVTLPSVLCFFAISVLAFLAKETFFVSFGILLSLAALSRIPEGRMATIGPFVALTMGLVVAFLVNIRASSPFLGGTAGAEGAYHQSFNPLSVSRQALNYWRACFPLAATCALLVHFVLFQTMAPSLRIRLIATVLPLAGFAAILPNSVLPNHFFPGYSWNMSYLLFAPVLMYPAIAIHPVASIRACLTVLLCGLVVSCVYFWRPLYRANDWSLAQMGILKNQDSALDVLASSTLSGDEPRLILVTGVPFPFSPFKFPPAMRNWTGRKDVRFDVVVYQPSRPDELPVRYVPASQVRPQDYRDIWAFSENGTGRAIAPDMRTAPEDLLTVTEQIVYPDAAAALGIGRVDGSSRVPSGQDLMASGIALIRYNNFALAAKLLEKAVAAIPNDPYASFYLAQAYEGIGRTEDAAKMAKAAFEHDNPSARNPFFAETVRRLEQPLETSPARRP